MHPQSPAVHEYVYPVSQRVNEMHGRVELETNQVDDRIATEGRDRAAERCMAFAGGSIEDYAFY